VCGLRHGWVQPIHDQQAHSNLSVLRSHVSVSTEEFYEKAHYVMQLAEQLHSALRCADSTSRRLSQQR
jgi:LuxR family transcriptional regulator